jgi:hypothetical protein
MASLENGQYYFSNIAIAGASHASSKTITFDVEYEGTGGTNGVSRARGAVQWGSGTKIYTNWYEGSFANDSANVAETVNINSEDAADGTLTFQILKYGNYGNFSDSTKMLVVQEPTATFASNNIVASVADCRLNAGSYVLRLESNWGANILKAYNASDTGFSMSVGMAWGVTAGGTYSLWISGKTITVVLKSPLPGINSTDAFTVTAN